MYVGRVFSVFIDGYDDLVSALSSCGCLEVRKNLGIKRLAFFFFFFFFLFKLNEVQLFKGNVCGDFL